MKEEVQALLNELQEVTTSEKGMRIYYSGTLFKKKVIVVFSRWGKVASATTATQLINDFDVSEIVFTGVAGALNDELNIGDVVIGRHLYQHDMDASPLYRPFEIPILKKLFLKTKNTTNLFDATRSFLKNYSKHIEQTDAVLFDITHPKVVIGDIASGDQFISSIDSIEKLNKSIPTALCVEMEGASVAQVCFEYQIPFSIIRIISDKANNNATIDFSNFSNAIASYYALGIFKNYFA